MNLKTQLLIFLFITILCNYLYSQFNNSFGQSASCQSGNNANCNKWWLSLDDKKRAVFAWGHTDASGNPNSDWVFCTGTLINQKVSDDKLIQYFVTARHCFEGENLNGNFVFYFNYQSPDCINNSVPDITDINGTNRDGRRYRHVSTITEVDQVWGSDFAMFRIDNPIPPHFNVYYAGWTKATFQGTQLPHHMIHHPRGDIKKIAKTWTTSTVTNQVCHVITTVIDMVFGWFDVSTNVEVICTYTELPFYDVPVWSDGCTEGGSSGASLLNSNGRIIGTLSGGPWTGSVPIIEPVGKFNTAYLNSSKIRNALNPDGDYIYSGISGTQIECYNELLNLNGDFFPAGDYQPENQIALHSSSDITTNGSLTVHSGAEFEFIANNSITLNPGFFIEPGAHFVGKVDIPCTNTKNSNSYNINSIIAGIKLPDYLKFDIDKYLTKDEQSLLNSKVVNSISPNPNNGLFQISLSEYNNESVQVLVFNMLGEMVLCEKDIYSDSFQINISNEPSGIYYVYISCGSLMAKEKIVVQ